MVERGRGAREGAAPVGLPGVRWSSTGTGPAGPHVPGPHRAAERRARRDRHGRGLRGPLYPGALPLWRSPAERFFELAAEVVADLSPQWGRHLDDLLLDIVEVPDPSSGAVVLAEVVVVEGDARLQLYRRPLEARAHDDEELEDLLLDVVVEAIADHLGIDPDELDPPLPG